MENESSGQLEIVLMIAEQAGSHVVRFQPYGESRMPPEVGSATQLSRESVLAVARGFRLFMDAAYQSVQPGLPPALPPRDLRARDRA